METDLEEVVQLAQNVAHNRGYAVHPCGSDKRPASPHGCKDAISDRAGIAELWRRYPEPLIGIATGAASGIDVLDVDVKHATAVAWWSVALMRMPATTLYRTRSGGVHAYFQHSEGVGNTASKLARGVDTRGDGGYVIFWFAAGFACEDHSPAAPWPPWLLECVLWKATPPPAATLARLSKPEHADKAIEGILRVVAVARPGDRNTVLHWGAHRLRERVKAGHIARGEASALLAAAARAAGLAEIEARRTIANAWRAG